MNLETGAKNTWCPGCGNFGILAAFKSAISEMVSEGMKKENFVIASGIGCHAKMVDYVNLNSFYSLHGRVVPALTGMKLANKNLFPIGFSGDGDSYNEGIAHLIHAAKRNTDITLVVHYNEVFALTTGQVTAISPRGFRGKSTPKGNPESPFNSIKLMLSAGATFVARSYSGNINHLKETIKQGIRHKGFSIIEVLQPCVVFNNTQKEYAEKTYDMNKKGHDFSDLDAAVKKSEEADGKIPIGIFYKKQEPVFEESV